ncbi:MAG: hypothetical protein ACRDS9_09105 [Pseudonocardiaceae bacterium]
MAQHVWRESVVETFYLADEAWQAEAETVAIGYETELREFAELHPRPTLKEAMLALAGRAPEVYADVESEAA